MHLINVDDTVVAGRAQEALVFGDDNSGHLARVRAQILPEQIPRLQLPHAHTLVPAAFFHK